MTWAIHNGFAWTTGIFYISITVLFFRALGDGWVMGGSCAQSVLLIDVIVVNQDQSIFYQNIILHKALPDSNLIRNCRSNTETSAYYSKC